jgi:hypothetical protein
MDEYKISMKGENQMVGKARNFQDAFRSSIILRQTQVVFLDRISISIREKTGAIIDRSAIIRALIDVFQSSGIDITEVSSEAEIAALLTERQTGATEGNKRKSKAKGE